MTTKHIYADENMSAIQKSRATELHKYIPSGVTLDTVDNVWMLTASIPLNAENLMHIQVKYFEEATVFNVVSLLPPHFNSDIFKRKIDSKSEDFLILDQYPARIYQNEFYGNVCLHLNVAYLYTEDGEDSYDINSVAEILGYIETTIKEELSSYLANSLN